MIYHRLIPTPNVVARNTLCQFKEAFDRSTMIAAPGNWAFKTVWRLATELLPGFKKLKLYVCASTSPAENTTAEDAIGPRSGRKLFHNMRMGFHEKQI